LWGLTSRKQRRLARWQSRSVIKLDERGNPYDPNGSEEAATDNSFSEHDYDEDNHQFLIEQIQAIKE